MQSMDEKLGPNFCRCLLTNKQASGVRQAFVFVVANVVFVRLFLEWKTQGMLLGRKVEARLEAAGRHTVSKHQSS